MRCGAGVARVDANSTCILGPADHRARVSDRQASPVDGCSARGERRRRAGVRPEIFQGLGPQAWALVVAAASCVGAGDGRGDAFCGWTCAWRDARYPARGGSTRVVFCGGRFFCDSRRCISERTGCSRAAVTRRDGSHSQHGCLRSRSRCAPRVRGAAAGTRALADRGKRAAAAA